MWQSMRKRYLRDPEECFTAFILIFWALFWLTVFGAGELIEYTRQFYYQNPCQALEWCV